MGQRVPRRRPVAGEEAVGDGHARDAPHRHPRVQDAAEGEPAEDPAEDEEEEDARPEDGHRHAHQDEDHRAGVEGGVGAAGGEDADPEPHDDGEGESGEGQLDGHGQRLADLPDHGLARADRVPEVPAQGPGEEADVLHVDRLVESELVAQPL